jgi:hypothetical protein
MKKMYFLIVIATGILLYAFVSCTTKQMQDNTLIRYDLSQSVKLSDYEVIFSFEDKYPIRITIKDSIAFIIDINDKTSFTALNVNKKISLNISDIMDKVLKTLYRLNLLYQWIQILFFFKM